MHTALFLKSPQQFEAPSPAMVSVPCHTVQLVRALSTLLLTHRTPTPYACTTPFTKGYPDDVPAHLHHGQPAKHVNFRAFYTCMEQQNAYAARPLPLVATHVS